MTMLFSLYPLYYPVVLAPIALVVFSCVAVILAYLAMREVIARGILRAERI